MPKRNKVQSVEQSEGRFVRTSAITIRISDAEREMLRVAATKEGRKMSDTARRAMLKGIK